MPKQDIFADTKQLDRLTIELKEFPQQLGTATYHALNRTIDQVITQVGRIVPKSYAVKSGEVKESFKGGIKRPTKEDLTASITSWGHTLSFAHFPYTPKTPKRGGRSIFQNAVVVTIKKDKGKILSRKGFVASTGAKKAEKTQYNVFMRLGTFSVATKGRYAGKRREDIAPIRTLSIPQMITNENVGGQIQKFASKKLSERLEHETIRAITSIGSNLKKG